MLVWLTPAATQQRGRRLRRRRWGTGRRRRLCCPLRQRPFAVLMATSCQVETMSLLLSRTCCPPCAGSSGRRIESGRLLKGCSQAREATWPRPARPRRVASMSGVAFSASEESRRTTCPWRSPCTRCMPRPAPCRFAPERCRACRAPAGPGGATILCDIDGVIVVLCCTDDRAGVVRLELGRVLCRAAVRGRRVALLPGAKRALL